jgi:hypothetical protein
MNIEKALNRAPDARAERMRLRESTTESLMRRGVHEWRSQPKKATDASLDRMRGNGMIQKLLGFHAQVAGPVDAAMATLRDPLANVGTGKALDRVEQIADRLTAPPPALGDAPDRSESPYLNLRFVPSLQSDPFNPRDKIPQYAIDNGHVETDILFLADLRKTYPPASAENAALGSLIDQLNAYRMLDPRIATLEAAERSRGGAETMMDAGGKKLGRVALVGILATATAIFGTIGLVQFIRSGGKQITLAPFLWAFATWFVADPNLVKSIFDKDAAIKKDFDELRTVSNDRTLQELSSTYGIGGPPWARVVERIYDGDHEKLHTLENPAPEAREQVARDLSGGNPDVEATLLRMMGTSIDLLNHRSDFTRFVEGLGVAQRTESKEFMIQYVEHDSFRQGLLLDPAAGKAIRDMQRARARQQKPV